jgi:hypothetical protein
LTEKYLYYKNKLIQLKINFLKQNKGVYMSNLLIGEIKSSASEGMIELSKEEQEMTLGGAASCTYGSQTYSQGATLSNGQTCQYDGTWSAATK